MARSSHKRKGFQRWTDKTLPALRGFIKSMDYANSLRGRLASILSRPQIISSAGILPLKDIRLRQLVDAGFNYADFRSWCRGQLNVNELEEFFNLHERRLSLRLFTEEKLGDPSPRLPFEPGVGDWSKVKSFCLEHNWNYHILVNETIPRDSIYSGSLILQDRTNYIVSCIEGFGTPRDVDEPNAKLRVFMKHFGQSIPERMPTFIAEMASRFENFLPQYRPMTIEFSYHRELVGHLQQPLVFWEWRDGSLHDLNKVIAYCLNQAQSHEIVIELAKTA